MLGSFVIDPNAPRWLASIHPYGLEQLECDKILAQPEFRDFQPLTLVDTRLAGEGVQDAVPTLVMGVDADKAFDNAATELPFQFVAGNRTEAIAQLSRGDFCLLSDWYAESAGAHGTTAIFSGGRSNCSTRSSFPHFVIAVTTLAWAQHARYMISRTARSRRVKK